MSQNIKARNVNNSFFDGYYKDIWRHIFPEKTTLAEVDFIINEGKLKPGDNVLDIMCGYGRHSLELARRGLNITAIDNLVDYINEVKDTSNKESLKIDAICEDALDVQIDKQYDAVLCMGNSLQFFNEEETLR